jgi:hypothetical protein
MRMQQRQITMQAARTAMNQARAVRIKFDEYQRLQAVFYGENNVVVVAQITGRFAGQIRTVWWTGVNACLNAVGL